jgi:hypothetical protein
MREKDSTNLHTFFDPDTHEDKQQAAYAEVDRSPGFEDIPE